jgi:hypothetical protein
MEKSITSQLPAPVFDLNVPRNKKQLFLCFLLLYQFVAVNF